MKKDFNKMKEKKVPFTKFDLIALGIVLILVVIVIAVTCANTQAPTVCKIYKDGKCVKTVTLKDFGDGVGFGETVGISRVYEYNGVRIIVYIDGVEISHANCYDEACTKSGKITKKGECIECTPSRIAVTLE